VGLGIASIQGTSTAGEENDATIDPALLGAGAGVTLTSLIVGVVLALQSDAVRARLLPPTFRQTGATSRDRPTRVAHGWARIDAAPGRPGLVLSFDF